MAYTKEMAKYTIKIDKEKLKKVREIEKKHYISKYCKSRKILDTDLPDYILPFQEPPTMNDVKKLAKKVLNDTYDFKGEDDWINTIVYRNLPNHEKANFRAKHLKHISLDFLDEKELKQKILKQKIEQQQEV